VARRSSRGSQIGADDPKDGAGQGRPEVAIARSEQRATDRTQEKAQEKARCCPRPGISQTVVIALASTSEI